MQDLISKTLVQIISDLRTTGDEKYFHAVLDYLPRGDQDGYPVVYLLPEQQPADYDTTAENKRREGFTAHILIPLEDSDVARRKVFNDMRTLSDVIRNAIDQTEDLNGLVTEDQKSRVMSVEPVSGGWEIVEIGTGEFVLQKLDIIVKYTYNFR